MKADVSRPTARKYLEAGQTPSELQVKRTWRTRPDPLAQIWPKAEAMLLDAPGLEAKVLFEHLWSQAPWEVGQKHLRTFQRRVKQWRLQHGPDKEVYFVPVPRTRVSPPPVSMAPMTSGGTASGHDTVNEARAAATASFTRDMGRSHRYTRVLSSRRSPNIDDANTSTTSGTSSDSPVEVHEVGAPREGVAAAGGAEAPADEDAQHAQGDQADDAGAGDLGAEEQLVQRQHHRRRPPDRCRGDHGIEPAGVGDAGTGVGGDRRGRRVLGHGGLHRQPPTR